MYDDNGKMIRHIGDFRCDMLNEIIEHEYEYVATRYTPMTFVLSVMCRSEVIKTMFQSDMIEGNTGQMKIRECSRKSFQGFQEYMYLGLGDILMEKADGRELYTLAEVYGVDELKTYLLERLDANCIGAAGAYFATREYEDPEVIDNFTKAGWNCVGEVPEESLKGVPVRIAAAILRGYASRNPVKAFEFVLRWSRNNNDESERRDTEMEQLLDLIDFRRMEEQDLTNIRKTSEILSEARIREITSQRIKSDEWSKSQFTQTTEYENRDPRELYQKISDMTLIHDSEEIGIIRAYTFEAESNVSKYTLNGENFLQIGDTGINDGQFERAAGIAVNTQGEVFVSDHLQNRIQVFTKMGEFLRAFGRKGNGDGQFHSPRKMCFDREGNLLVCDHYNYRIALLRQDGEFVYSFAMEPLEYTRMIPEDVCCDMHDGSIVVCGKNEDTYAHSVQLFSGTGKYMKTISSGGEEPDQYQSPCAVSISAYGHVLVADNKKHEIMIFDAMGRYVNSVRELENVSCVEADQTGERLYIAKDYRQGYGKCCSVFCFERTA